MKLKQTEAADAPKPKSPTVLRLTLRERIDDLIMRELGVDEKQATPNTRLQEDLGADSLDVAEMAIVIEEEFEIPEIDDAQVDKILTVGHVHRYVERATAAKKKKR